MTIVEAFRIIQSDETKCARIVGTDHVYSIPANHKEYIQCLREGKPFGGVGGINVVGILSDWEILNINDL